MGAANGGSTVRVHRSTGRLVQDDTTGLEVPEWAIVLDDLPARIGGTSRGPSPTRNVPQPGGDVQTAVRVAHLPATTTDLADGDLIEVLYGEHAGRLWRIVEADPADQQTALRVPVVAANRPEEWSA